MATDNSTLHRNIGFSIGKTELKTATASRHELHDLPTPARPLIDAADVVVPDGYTVEPVLVGLSFPTDVSFADDGTIFVSEGGSSWPIRPYAGPGNCATSFRQNRGHHHERASRPQKRYLAQGGALHGI